MGKQLTNEEFQSRLSAMNIDAYTDDIYKTSKDIMTFYCSKSHRWKAQVGSILYGHTGCPYCSGRYAITGETDLWTVRPDVAKLLKNQTDGYKHTPYSNKKVIFTCPECGTDQPKIIGNVCNQGFSCKVCSDGISYPNKFARNMLNQIGIKNVTYEWRPDWVAPYFYDNYFEYNGKEYILEMDGRMGHGNNLNEIPRNSGLYGMELDLFKDNKANEHGIIVIRIDCAYKYMSDRFNYIKNSIINSELSHLFDLSNIDWSLCNKCGVRSEMMIAANMYLQGNTVGHISKAMKHSDSTIVNWLKIITNVGKCNYDPYESRRRSKSKDVGYIINQYDMNNVFVNTYMSSHEVERKTGISSRTICNAIQSKSHKSHNFIWYKADDTAQPDKSKIISNNTKLIKEVS